MVSQQGYLSQFRLLERFQLLARSVGARALFPLRDGSLALVFDGPAGRRELIWHPNLRAKARQVQGVPGSFSAQGFTDGQIPSLVERLLVEYGRLGLIPIHLSPDFDVPISLDRWFVTRHLDQLLEENRTIWGNFLFTRLEEVSSHRLRLVFVDSCGDPARRLSFLVVPAKSLTDRREEWMIVPPLALRIEEDERLPESRRQIAGRVENYLVYALAWSFHPQQPIRDYNPRETPAPDPSPACAAPPYIVEPGSIMHPPYEPPQRYSLEDVRTFLADAAPVLDLPRIEADFAAIAGRFPGPQNDRSYGATWCQELHAEDGLQARRRLFENFPAAGRRTPMSIYIHLPFCEQHCVFCSCYFLPKRVATGPTKSRYLSLLLGELTEWAALDTLGQRPVTTVHFGGGTPLFFGHERMALLLTALRQNFAIREETELALETTVRRLGPKDLEFMKRMGIRRVHVGLQTLEPELRAAMGRRSPVTLALERVAQAVREGFIVTADMIVGLPGETFNGFLGDIQRLVDCGVSGVSVGPLEATSRNEAFIRQIGLHNRNYLAEYLMLQAAQQILTRCGYEMRFYGHYARPEDKNLYMLYATRGEDLLGMGVSAVGEFGRYRYSNGYWDTYLLREIDQPRQVLRGRLEPRSPRRKVFSRERLEERLTRGIVYRGILEGQQGRPLLEGPGLVVAGLTDGRVNRELALREAGEEEVRLWLDQRLVRLSSDGNDLCMTANGAWFFSGIRRALERRAMNRIRGDG